MQKIIKNNSIIRISQLFQEQKQIIQHNRFQQVHRKKLELIKTQRRQGLLFDTDRDHKIFNIRQNKSKTFALKFNESNKQISKDNMIMFLKLKQAQKSHKKILFNQSFTKQSRSLSESMMRDRNRKQTEFTQKENLRIAVKLKSISSNLNTKKLLQEYHNRVKIRNRIQKFENEKGLKVSLKNERSLKIINQSRVLSHASLNNSKLFQGNRSSSNSKLYSQRIPSIVTKKFIEDKQKKSSSLRIKVDNSVKKNFFQKQSWKKQSELAFQRYIQKNKNAKHTSNPAKLFQSKQKLKN